MSVIRMLVLVAMCCSCLMEAAAQTAALGKGFERFRGLRTRNIFDPDRRGPRPENSSATAPNPQPAFLQLTGTMVSGGKTLAFFSGSRPEFSKVLSVQGKVGEYTVQAITPGQVDLEREGSSITLPVGKQISLDGKGTVSAAQPISPSSSTSSGNSSSSGSSPTPPAGVPADKSEVLRRMMERRQQEASK